MIEFFLDKIDLSTFQAEDIESWHGSHPAQIVGYAAKKGKLAAVKLVHEFMERNLDRKYIPLEGLTLAYIVALKKGYKDIREYTERSAETLAPYVVEMAARVRDKALIEFFFEVLNKYEREGHDYLNKLRSLIARWGLRGAARGGHRDLVEKFIELGADDVDRMEEGMTQAAEGGHLELVKFFEERGARNYSSVFSSALSAAAKKCRVEVLDYLRPHISPEKFLKEIKRESMHGKPSRRQCIKAYLATL